MTIKSIIKQLDLKSEKLFHKSLQLHLKHHNTQDRKYFEEAVVVNNNRNAIEAAISNLKKTYGNTN